MRERCRRLRCRFVRGLGLELAFVWVSFGKLVLDRKRIVLTELVVIVVLVAFAFVGRRRVRQMLVLQ